MRRLTTMLALTCICASMGMVRADKVDDYIAEQMAKRHVPGLSVADETEVGILENGAPRTAYLVDSDKGGGELRRQLQHAHHYYLITSEV